MKHAPSPLRDRPVAIERLLGAQIALRNSRRLVAAMRSSRLPAIKTLADFDFTFQPSRKREQVESPPHARLSRAPRERDPPRPPWGEIFGDEVMASALIDRLVHHRHIVNIRGNSYRMKHHAALAAALRHEPDDGPATPTRRSPRRETAAR